jgi:tetratricopeptide (TPR) repeat protein
LIGTLVAASVIGGCSRNLLHQAQQYELAGKNAEALQAYQQALAHTSDRDSRKRSEILLRMGECLYRMDRITEAFSTFQKAADADKNNTTAHLRMGEMYLSAGIPDRAREQATLVLNGLASNNEALALLGAAWAAADNPAMAKQAYERVLTSDPKRVTVAVALADIYNREDNVAKAREILKQSAAAQPQSALPWLAMARLDEQEGDSQAAEDSYRRAVSIEDTPATNLRLAHFLQRSTRVVEAEQVLRRVDAQRKNYPVALGDFKLSSGQAGNAIDQYEAALSAMTLHDPKERFWERFRGGAIPSSAKDRGAVAARYIEAEIAAAWELGPKERTAAFNTIRKNLDDFRPWFDPATTAVLETELALADNNLVLAHLSASSALALAPESAAAHYVSGLVNDASGNGGGAQAEWLAAVEKDPHFNPARLALAEHALKRLDGEEADQQARAVVRDDPGNFYALIIFAKALLMEGKPASAAIIAHRASALDPSAVEPSILLGEVSLQLNHLPEALMAFERAVVSHPSSEEAIEGLLSVYRRSKVSYAALEKMERTAQTPPVSSTLLELAGRLYADHGWYNEAIRALTKAVEADPKRATAARQLAQLQMATGDFSQASTVAAHVGGDFEVLVKAYHSQVSGEWQQAITNYERALRQGDQSGAAANNLAWLYAEHHAQLDRALELAETAVKLSPNNPSVLDTLGFVLLQRREYTSAVKVLETAARLTGPNGSKAIDRGAAAQIRQHLNAAYLAAGETEAAGQLAQNRGPFALK